MSRSIRTHDVCSFRGFACAATCSESRSGDQCAEGQRVQLLEVTAIHSTINLVRAEPVPATGMISTVRGV